MDHFFVGAYKGHRTYIQSRLYLEPWRHQDIRLADAQAWWYPADHTIVLWELLLAPQFESHTDPRESLTLRQLWLRYERYLVDRFTDAEAILTTWEDAYDRDQWTGFLAATGYRQTGLAVFRKDLRH